MKSALQAIGDNNSGTVDLANIDTDLADLGGFDSDNDNDHESDDEDEDNPAELQAADSVGKALLLVKQVRLSSALADEHHEQSHDLFKIRASPQARAFFKKSCRQVEVPVIQLLLWIHTRWASLYAFLDRLLILKKVWPLRYQRAR